MTVPLAVIAGLGALQWRAVRRMRDSDEAQLHTVAYYGAQGVAWDFNHELGRAYDWFQVERPADFAFAHDTWLEKAHEPLLFHTWYLADGDQLVRFDPATGKLLDVAWPAELEPVRLALQEERVLPEVADPAALLVPLPFGGHAIGLLDLDYLRDTIFPALVHDNLGDPDGLDYDVEVVLARDPAQAIWVDAARPIGDAPEIDVPIFRVGFAHLDGLLVDVDEDGLDDGVWRLRARHKEGSIAVHVAGLRRRDLWIALGVVGLLLASVGLLWASLRRARRLADQQLTFVAGITHELRTPLAVIRSAAENLADGCVSEPSKVRRYGQLLLGEGRRLSAMVEQAIDVAALEAGAKARVETEYDVAALVEELPGVTASIARPLPALRGDPAATRLVLGNLVENARKHAPGSPIDVSVAAAERGVRIEVSDRGEGIDAADVPHLFEPFYRGRRARAGQVPGSGLGLSVVKRLVEQQRGSIAVRSLPGQGASFVVHLPGGRP